MSRMRIKYEDDDGSEVYITKRGEAALEAMDTFAKAAEIDGWSNEEYWEYRKAQDNRVEVAKRNQGFNVSKRAPSRYPVEESMIAKVDGLQDQVQGGDTAYDVLHGLIEDVAIAKRDVDDHGYGGLSDLDAYFKLLEDLNSDDTGRLALNWAATAGRGVQANQMRVAKSLGSPRDSEAAYGHLVASLVEFFED